MDVHLWSYLWDIAAVGVTRALDEMQAAGVTGVSVATSYHAGRFVQPRLEPEHLYYPEDGTVHVPIEAGDGIIQPQVSHFALDHPRLMEILRRETRERGMALSSWTVMLHNSRLGALHPDATVENAFGARLIFNLCPSHPEVQRYAVNLATALASNYDLDVFELESLGYMNLVHEYHHEKDGVGLTPAERMLSSVCFCRYCMDSAAKAGVDGERARLFVRSRLNEAFARELPAPGQALEELWVAPELEAYWQQRLANVHGLIREIRSAVPHRTELRVLDLFGPDEARFYGLDYGRVLDDADSVCSCLYERPAEAVLTEARRVLAATGTASGVWAGFRLFVPEMRDRDDFLAKISAAHDAGIRSYSLYNYGLVPEARLGWIRAAVEAMR